MVGGQRRLGEKERAGLTGVEADVVCVGDRQRHDALIQTVEIDDGLGFLLLRRGRLRGRLGDDCLNRSRRRLDRLVVALRRDRRRFALLQHRNVHVAAHGMLVAGHVETLRGQARVRAGGEVQILAARIELRITRIAHAVGDLPATPFLERIHLDRMQIIGQDVGIGQPAAIRRPRRAEIGLAEALVRGGGDLHRRGMVEVEVPEVEALVRIRDLLAIGRPQRTVEERRLAQGDRAGRFETFLIADEELILAGFVGEPRDRLAVGRPGRVAILDARTIGDVARVAVFGGYGQNVAVRFEHRALPRRREVDVFDLGADLLPVRTHLRQVARNRDADLARLARLQIVDVQRVELGVNDRTRPRRRGGYVETGAGQKAGDSARLRVVREERHRTVAIGEEIDRIADPHRVVVVRIVARHAYDARIGQVGNVHRRRLPAAIALPKRLPAKVRNVRQVRGIGRERARLGHGQWEPLRKAAGCGHGKQLIRIRRAVAIGSEEHVLAVGRPTDGDVCRGMIGQTPGLAARGRDHVDVDVLVVHAGEGDLRSVGRKDGARFEPVPRRQAMRGAARAVDDPNVAAVGKGDLRATDRGIAQ